MKKAGFSYAIGPKELIRSKRYKEEYARQEKLYRQEKQAEKRKKRDGGGQ